MTGPTVLLLGSNERAALAVCRSLGKSNTRVEILRFTKEKTPADFSRYCSRAHFIGEPYADVRRYSEALLALVADRRYDYVFPMNDVANELVYFNYKALGSAATVIGPTPENYRKASNKQVALEIGAQAGVSAPTTIYLAGDDPPLPALDFPIYAKPVTSALISENYLHTFSVRKLWWRDQLESKLREDLPRTPVLLQEVISGTGVGLNFTAFKGTLCGVSVTIRLHEPTDGGGSSYRRTGEVTPELLDVAKAIAHQLDWTGLMMVELKVHGGDLYLMELNCRPWGSIDLSIQSGVDHPRLVLEAIARQAPADAVALPARRMYMRNLKSDIGWILRRRRAWLSKDSELPAWLWSFRRLLLGHEAFDVERLRDVMPGLSQPVAALSHLGVRASHLLRGVVAKGDPAPGIRHLSPTSTLLFVCRGNINRSVVAQHYLAANGYRNVSSAGLIRLHGRRPSVEAEKFLQSLGIDASAHRSRDVRTLGRELDEADLVIVFDRSNARQLAALYPRLRGRLHLLSSIGSGGGGAIRDPDGRGAAEYRVAFDRIVGHLDRLTAINQS